MLFIIIILQLYMLLLREAGTEIHENHDFSIFTNFSSIFKFTIITYNNSSVSDFFMFFIMFTSIQEYLEVLNYINNILVCRLYFTNFNHVCL